MSSGTWQDFSPYKASVLLKLLVDTAQEALTEYICVTGYTQYALTPHTHTYTVVRPIYVMTMWCTMLSDGPIKVSDVGCPSLAL